MFQFRVIRGLGNSLGRPYLRNATIGGGVARLHDRNAIITARVAREFRGSIGQGGLLYGGPLAMRVPGVVIVLLVCGIGFIGQEGVSTCDRLVMRLPGDGDHVNPRVPGYIIRVGR